MQAGTDSDPEQSVGAQNVHSSERQHQADLQQSNSDVWLQPAELVFGWVGAEIGIYPGSAVELLFAWLFDYAAGDLECALVAV